MSSQVPRGYYVDAEGALRRDRRRSSERRDPVEAFSGEDRRNKHRRRGDRVNLKREHHEMIEDALEEFVTEHER